MLNGHAYSRAVRAHILTNLILAERGETENKLRESSHLVYKGK
jgi:hypothetical protein